MLKTMYDYRKYASYEAYADAMKEEEKKRAQRSGKLLFVPTSGGRKQNKRVV